MLSRKIIDSILAIVPKDAKACYTGQSILAYCPDPTFTFEEMNTWEVQTDIDIFAYNNISQASIVQSFLDAGWRPDGKIEEFKANRIRFWEPSKKYSLQTVKLKYADCFPIVNISWRKNCTDCIEVIKNFDMDYLMVSMDLKTGVFCDLRGENHHVAHVNKYNNRFDPIEAEPTYWYRQFERCPKGWNRGIDTRPVAEQYAAWIRKALEVGDKGSDSVTRQYYNRDMEKALAPIIETGMEEEQAQALYHLIRGEANTWESLRIQYEQQLKIIETWLESVKEL